MTYCDLYYTADDPKKLQKTLTPIALGIKIVPTQTINLLQPTITINYSDEYLQANYIYFSLFERYYYINDISVNIGKSITFLCTIDVLHTYAEQLKSCTVAVVRSESAGVNYTDDPQLPIDPKRTFVQGITFPNSPLTESTNGRNYMLSVNATYNTTE